MSSGDLPPPPPRPIIAGGRAGAPHPTSMFSKRPPTGVGAPAPFSATEADPSARRSNILSVYSQYKNPMTSSGPVATTSSTPPPPLPPSSASNTIGNGSSPSGPPPVSWPPPSHLSAHGGAIEGQRGYLPPTLTNVSHLPPPPPSLLPKGAIESAPDEGAAALLPPPPPPPPPTKTMGKHVSAAGPRYAVPDFAFGEAAESAQATNQQQQQPQRVPSRERKDNALLSVPAPLTATPPSMTACFSTNPKTPPTAHSRPIIHSATQHVSGRDNMNAAPPLFFSSTPSECVLTGTSAPIPSPPPPPPLPSKPPAPKIAPPLSNSSSTQPLTTRVSGAGLRGTNSSRASSNGNDSRSSSQHNQRDRRNSRGDSTEKQQPQHPQKRGTSSLFAFPSERSETSRLLSAEMLPKATPSAAPGYHTIPNSNNTQTESHGSNGVTPPTASATGGNLRASSTVRPANTPASFQREIPSFLRPSGSAGCFTLSHRGQSGVATATAAGTSAHTISSRGRELLEAALKSRASRVSHSRGSDAGNSAATAESILNSMRGKEKQEKDSVDRAVPAVLNKPVEAARQEDGAFNAHLPNTTASSKQRETASMEMDREMNEVCDMTHNGTPVSSPLDRPFTLIDATSQRSHSASPNFPPKSITSAFLTAGDEEHTKTAAQSPGGNPFLDSGTDESELAFGLDVPMTDAPSIPEQPPPLPHHTEYIGMPSAPTPQLITPIEDTAAVNNCNPFADAQKANGGCADAWPASPPPPPLHPNPSNKALQPAVVALPLQPPPLPSLPPQRPAVPNGTVLANTSNDYNTPRGGAAEEAGLEHQRRYAVQPATVLPLASSTTTGSVMRGPYAASPYIRDEEGRRAVEDESPVPLRPPSFNSMQQPEVEEAQIQKEGDGTFSAQSFSVPPPRQEEKQHDDIKDEPNSASLPLKWDAKAPGIEEGARSREVTEGNYRGDNVAQGESAPRRIELPNGTVLPSTVAALAHQHSNNRTSSPPQPQLADAGTTEQANSTTDVPPPSPPPSSSLSVPANPTRGDANVFLSRRNECLDDLRRQHQEQLQALVQAADSTSSTTPAAAVRDRRPSTPNAEEPTKHFYEALSQRSTLAMDSYLGNSSNIASLTSRPAPPQMPQQQQQALGNSSPLDLKDHGSIGCPNFASMPNPFLEPGENQLLPPNKQTVAATAATAASTELHALPSPKPQHSLTSSFSSLAPQQVSFSVFSVSLEPLGRSVNSRFGQPPAPTTNSTSGVPVLNLTEDGCNALANNDSNNNILSSSGISTGTASRSPGGTVLVNPFSKAARNNVVTVAADGGSNVGQSPGTSLASSFAGWRKSRRIGAPCFAIFLGGATKGVPNKEMSKGVSCIAACFNKPRAQSPAVNRSGAPHHNGHNNSSTAGGARSPAEKVPLNSGAPSLSPHPAGAMNVANRNSSNNNTSLRSGIYISFCSVAEALTAKGSVVDRKGIRGTESGRRYVRALRDAVLPCALAANEWATIGPKWSEMAAVMQALESCVPAPLVSVLTIILKDAMEGETREGFVWKNNGDRRLGELLLQAAQTQSFKHACTAVNASLLNVAADGSPTAMMDAKEKSAALLKVENLLCAGQRPEAVEAALEARLYVHALLISMMCPTKDEYLRTVQAVTQNELVLHSPLAHAYSMFNELPLPPLLPPLPSLAVTRNDDEDTTHTDGAADQNQRHMRETMLRSQATLRETWCRHAAMLLTNFTRHSGEGLLNLAGSLHELHLVAEAHTCLLLLHLTPLGMAAPVRSGAEPLPPASAMTAEELEDVLPRRDQQQVMEEIRRRMGVVGGTYHPTQGCRSAFLTPVTTLLTQLLELVREQLNARAPPLEVPGRDGPPVTFHGLPGCLPCADVSYRMMQVLWLREVGLLRESKQALSALLQRMPAPAAFSVNVPPRSLNEFVYLFGGVPPPRAGETPPPPLGGFGPPEMILPPKGEEQPLDAENARRRSDRVGSETLPAPADEKDHDANHEDPPPQSQSLRQPMQRTPPPPPTAQQGRVENAAALSPPPPQPQQSPPMKPPGGAADRPPINRTAALQPPMRPLPQQQPSPPEPSVQDASPPSPPDVNNTTKPAPKLAAKPAAASPASRRSRSMEALRNLFFRRGKSESDAGAEKTEEAKPMHLDTEKLPAFDPVTGRWMFPETEEEKKLRELTMQGPPKMAPKTTTTAAAAPAPTEPAGNTPPAAPSGGNITGPQTSLPLPVVVGGGANRLPGPRGVPASAFAPGRGAPPPTMAGRGGGVRRPGGRQQYVDAFNSTN